MIFQWRIQAPTVVDLSTTTVLDADDLDDATAAAARAKANVRWLDACPIFSPSLDR